MDIHATPVELHGLEPSLQLLNEGFADYIVPIQISRAAFENMVRTASIDLDQSLVASVDGIPAGVALIARRGNESRVAAMSIKPEFRGRGSGRAFLSLVVDDARRRKERRMVLEVIESNEPAVRLYTSAGFKPIRRLESFELDGVSARGENDQDSIIPVDVRDVATVVAEDGLADLPWQVGSETVSRLEAPNVGFRLEDSYAVISDPGAGQVFVQCLITRQKSRRKGNARRLVESIFARYPGKRWMAPAIYPEEMAPFFTALGFARAPISQLQMAIELDN